MNSTKLLVCIIVASELAIVSCLLPDDLELPEVDCIDQKFKSCYPICQHNKNKELKNLPCCLISRCHYCIYKIGMSVCGDRVKEALTNIFNLLIHVTQSCPEDEIYPSFKCAYFWYPAWFYVIPPTIFIFLTTSIIVLVVARKNRIQGRKPETKKDRRKRPVSLRRYNSSCHSNENVYVEENNRY